MNRMNRESFALRAKALAASTKARGVALIGTVSMLPGLAMAQDATFDPSTITSKITTYAGYALVIVLALAAAVWGLRAAGLIGGRR
ncbi:hypothetical protein [Stenotrophomonas sp. VV52]|uniref:hypothetical protein n=1 Tax=Stenotrophomonas sp. VV52 TaxID=2066958 RepID=UPI0011AF880D|nr:hypothetical protein [Stenotrophomonas sp. VV52]